MNPPCPSPEGGEPGPGGERGWGAQTEQVLRDDAQRATRLRDAHLRRARLLAACGWLLCAVGGVCAVLSTVLGSGGSGRVAPAVLAAVSGACNALQRVPGPSELASRRYDLAARLDLAAARCAALLDQPRASRPDAYTALALIGQQIDGPPR